MKGPCQSRNFAHRGMIIPKLNTIMELMGVPSGNKKDKYFQMKMRYFFSLLAISFVLTGIAQARTSSKKHKVYFKLIEAYIQRMLPGIPGAPPQTNYHFIIVWDAPKYPETFFWRGDGGWLTCNIVKVHKITNKSRNIPQGVDYMKENISVDQIHKGDTLELNPVTGGKFPVPGEIPSSAKNTLFFKTGGSGWLAFPVKNISKKQDIAMP